MAAAPASARAQATVRQRADDSSRQRPRRLPEPHAPYAPWWQLARDDLLAELANVPSRADKPLGRALRADLAENVGRFYDALWRRAHAQRTTHFATSWHQLGVANGYDDDEITRPQMQRYAALLAEAGLVDIAGVKDRNGVWRRLEVRLLEPPSLASGARRDSSVGGAPLVACDARRRRETRSQRHSRRVRPYRRAGGRGRAVARWSLSWTSEMFTPERAPTPRDYVPSGVGARSCDDRTTVDSLTAQRQSEGVRRGAGSAGLSDTNRRRSARQDDPERQRVRAIVRAALEAALVTEDQESVTARSPIDALAERLAWRHSQLERLVGKTRPRYDDFAVVFSLVCGGRWSHATGPVAAELERSAARYDRFALRLADAGQPLEHPTALAWYVAETRRRDSAVSPGFAVRALRVRSLQLRAAWRELDDPDGAKAAERRHRRDHRRERRIRAMAGRLRAGVELPVHTPPAHRCREWLAAALREPAGVSAGRYDELLSRAERRQAATS